METIQFIGKANDLYCNKRDGQIKSVGVVQLAEDENNGCDLNLTLTSLSRKEKNFEHKLIDELLGHTIRFTLDIID